MKIKLPIASETLKDDKLVLVQSKIVSNMDTLTHYFPRAVAEANLSVDELQIINNDIETLINLINDVFENRKKEISKLDADTSVDC